MTPEEAAALEAENAQLKQQLATAEADKQKQAAAKRHADKPMLSCWLGDATVGPAREVLRTANIPTFRTPEAAVGAFSNMANYHINQQLLQQTPAPLSSNLAQPDIEGARQVAERLRLRVEKMDVPDVGHVTASFGVATFPIHASSRDTLVTTADRALYQAKHSGRNRSAVLSMEGGVEVLARSDR